MTAKTLATIGLFGLAVHGVCMAAPPAPAVTPAELAAELSRLEASIEPGRVQELRTALPSEWIVQTPERRYAISTAPLAGFLSKGQGDIGVSNAKDWLDHLARQLESSATPSQVPADSGDALHRILSRPEFAGVKAPGALAILRQRIYSWVIRMLEKLFQIARQHPTSSRILFWTVLFGSVAIIALWLYRFWTRNDQLRVAPKASPSDNSRHWKEWMAAAHQAAARNDLREAIHCAYWAGVARLQEIRVLPGDRTRTPREYLGVLVGSTPNSVEFQAPLAALTSRMERFWYAGRPAGIDDFNESLHHLEALGCKVD